MPCFRETSKLRDLTQVSWIAGGFFTILNHIKLASQGIYVISESRVQGKENTDLQLVSSVTFDTVSY